MPSQVFFRKAFQSDRDVHTWNLRLLEDILNAPISNTGGAISGVMTFGDVNALHLDIGVQEIDGTTYFIVAWDGDLIVTGLKDDGTWT